MHPMLSVFLGILALCLLPARGAAETRIYNLTIHKGEAAPGGNSRPVYLINNQQPAPLIEANEGDTLEVFVKNELPVETTLHWHGILQRGTPQMDGVPGVTQYPIVPGGNFTYRFTLENEYGFYWYHSHFRAYYSDAIRGPLMIHPKPSRTRPFESLASDDTEVEHLLKAEKDAFPVLLADWYHQPSDQVLSEYNRTGVYPHCVDSLLANGMGRVQCLPEEVLRCGTRLCSKPDITSTMSMESSDSMNHMPMSSFTTSSDMLPMDGMANPVSSTLAMEAPVSASSHSAEAALLHQKRQMSGMSDMATALGPRGCTPPMMFRPGFNASDLAPETCIATMAPYLTIPANASSGWLALNLVNAGSTSKLTVSLDSHTMHIYAADGLYVQMQEVKALPIGIGERYSVMVKLDQSPSEYLLRFAAIPNGDMQQVIEDVAIVQYTRSAIASSIGDVEPFKFSRNNHTGSILGDTDDVYILLNGSAKSAASTLQPQDLKPFDPIAPPRGNKVISKNFNISQVGIVSWVVDRYPYSEPTIPVILGNISDGWSADTTLHMPFNATIDLILRIAPDSMDAMGHPMHLHGHKFWVLGSGQGDFPYTSVQDAPRSLVNLENPPYRDTVELPNSGWAVVRYISDNPGAWLFHCHIQWHLVSGMGLVLVEGEDRLPALIGSSNVTLPTNSTGSPGPQSANDAQGRSAAIVLGPALTILGISLASALFLSLG